MAEPMTPERYAEIKARHDWAIERFCEAEALDTSTAQDRADLLAEVERLQRELDTAVALAPLRRSDYGPAFHEHASLVAIAFHLRTLRKRRDALDRVIQRLNALHERRTAALDQPAPLSEEVGT